jgi:hypothetical protein
MLTLLLAATLGAQAAPPKVAVTTPVKESAPDHASARRLLEPLRDALRTEGLDVLTEAQARARAPTTRAADCGRNRACLALYAGALGVDWLVVVETDAVEKDLAVAIFGLSPSSPERPELTFVTTVHAPDLEARARAFAPTLAATARREASLLRKEDPAEPSPPPLAAEAPPAVPAPAPRGINAGGVGAGVVGAVFLVGGGVLLNSARRIDADLRSPPGDEPPYPPERWTQLKQQGQTRQVLGFVGVGVGLAAAATSVLLFTAGGEGTQQTSMSVAAGPGEVRMAGRF